MRFIDILKCLYRLPEFRETIIDSNKRLESSNERLNSLERLIADTIERLAAETNERLERLAAETNERLERLAAETNQRLERLAAETNQQHETHTEKTEAQVEALQTYASAVTQDRIEPLEAEIKTLREGLVDIATQGNFPDQYYVDLEDLFRGSSENIEARLQPYIPLIENNGRMPKDKPAIDLGCGRGEWLDLLSRHSFETIGVDLNEQFLNDCEKRGHRVHLGDALDYLVACEDDSSSIISAFHLIEHLSNRVLVDIVAQALRVLAPGGMLIFETPNPENIAVSADTFYLDPTHTSPRHPLTMHFLVKRNGFAAVEILRLAENRLDPVTPFDALEQQLEGEGAKQATAFLREKFFAAPDYAIVAVKP